MKHTKTLLAMGLIKNDKEIEYIFEEAVMLPKQLRQFFVWFLLTENIHSKKIWDQYKKFYGEDFKNYNENRALLHIQDILSGKNRYCEEFGLPQPFVIDEISMNEEEIKMTSKLIFDTMYSKLNVSQGKIFEFIIGQKHKFYFIDGPGGTGKTFLYKTLIHYFIMQEKNITSMAWTGIAAILLPQGKATHQTFKCPLNINDLETSILNTESDKKKLREMDVIIWDEASRIPKKALEIVDQTLQD